MRLLTDKRAQFWIQQYHKAEFLEVYVDSLILAIEENQRLCDSLSIAHRGVISAREQEVKLLEKENRLLVQSEGISNQMYENCNQNYKQVKKQLFWTKVGIGGLAITVIVLSIASL